MDEFEDELRRFMRPGYRVHVQPLWQKFVHPDKDHFVYLAMVQDYTQNWKTWSASGDTPVEALRACIKKVRGLRLPSAKKVGRCTR